MREPFGLGLIFMGALILCLNEGSWFPWPNICGGVMLVWFAIIAPPWRE